MPAEPSGRRSDDVCDNDVSQSYHNLYFRQCKSISPTNGFMIGDLHELARFVHSVNA